MCLGTIAEKLMRVEEQAMAPEINPGSHRQPVLMSVGGGGGEVTGSDSSANFLRIIQAREKV